MKTFLLGRTLSLLYCAAFGVAACGGVDPSSETSEPGPDAVAEAQGRSVCTDSKRSAPTAALAWDEDSGETPILVATNLTDEPLEFSPELVIDVGSERQHIRLPSVSVAAHEVERIGVALPAFANAQSPVATVLANATVRSTSSQAASEGSVLDARVASDALPVHLEARGYAARLAAADVLEVNYQRLTELGLEVPPEQDLGRAGFGDGSLMVGAAIE